MKVKILLLLAVHFVAMSIGYAQNTTNLGTGSGTGGQENTNIGYLAGQNAAGMYNTNVGAFAGIGLTSGIQNTFIGYASGRYTTSADYNTFVGSASGYTNTIGRQNVFIGRSAGYLNTTGSFNVYIGENSGVLGVTATRNTFVGEASGYSSTASDNTLFGYYSGNVISSGTKNTFSGVNTGVSNTTGSSNTVSGYQALYANTTASFNTAIGQEALYNNTGYMNTGVGYRALYSNITGYKNAALGYQANVNSGALSNATAIGYRALVTASNTIQLGNDSVTQVFAGVGTKATIITGGLKVTGGTMTAGMVLTSDGTGVATWQPPSATGGNWSLYGNSGTVDGTNFIGTTDNRPFTIRVNNQISGRIETELGNTLFGYRAGNGGVSVGQYNTANGYAAMVSNTDGMRNTAVGYQSLYENATADGNTALGYQALAHTISDYNTALGAYALSGNTTGTRNNAQGASALLNSTLGSYNNAFGSSALNANTIGAQNSAFGNQALQLNTTGGNNSAFGALAGPNAANLDNTTALGSGATTTASNQVRIGNSSVTSIGGQVSWSTLSDGRFKKDIRDDVSGLEFINQLRPVSYTIDQGAFDKFIGVPDSIRQRQSAERAASFREDGFIAQEVDALVRKNGYVFHGVEAPKNDNDHYSIRYAEFVVPLVKAVQELTAITEQQQKLIELLMNDRKDTSPLETLREKNSEIQLFQNVPNPFSENTEIKLILPETAKQASLMIYNLEGTQLKSMPIQDRGNVSASISANTLQAGMYIYALIVDGKVIDTKRMILTK